MESVVFKETSNRCHTSAPSPLLAVADSEGSITLYQRREVNLERILDLILFLMNFLCVGISHSTLLNTMCAVRHLMSLSGLVKSQVWRIASSNFFLPKIQVLKIMTVV
jgi:hypothetical protein